MASLLTNAELSNNYINLPGTSAFCQLPRLQDDIVDLKICPSGTHWRGPRGGLPADATHACRPAAYVAASASDP